MSAQGQTLTHNKRNQLLFGAGKTTLKLVELVRAWSVFGENALSETHRFENFAVLFVGAGMALW